MIDGLQYSYLNSFESIIGASGDNVSVLSGSNYIDITKYDAVYYFGRAIFTITGISGSIWHINNIML